MSKDMGCARNFLVYCVKVFLCKKVEMAQVGYAQTAGYYFLRRSIIFCLPLFWLITGWCQETPQPNNISTFTVKGIVSWERFEPNKTNYVEKVTCDFLFSYSNYMWRIQTIYKGGSIAGTLADYRRIPDGIRVIWNFSSNALAFYSKKEVANAQPSALVRADKFPDMGQQELFLPWLSLCPRPELPIIDSAHMPFLLINKMLSYPQNRGTFDLNYILPDSQFVSELTVSNNGVMISPNGTAIELPPPYNHGYTQFAYKIIDTTNCSGVLFPHSAILYQYAPSQSKKSSNIADTYPAVISRIDILQVDVGSHSLSPIPAPTNLVALDSRPPELKNDMTVNYHVRDDQWLSLTNPKMQQLIAMDKGQAVDQHTWAAEHSKNKKVVYALFSFTTLLPLVYLTAVKLKKTNNKNKQK